MWNIRESSILESPIFIQREDSRAEIGFIYLLWGFVVGILGFLFNAMLVAGPWWFDPSILFITIPLVVLFWIIGPQLGKAHKLYKIPNKNDYYHRYNNKHHQNLHYARKYLALSKEDRALFPHNILDVLRNPDLDKRQRQLLDSEMQKVFQTINARDAQRKALEAKRVDIESIVEDLRRGQEYAQVEVDTLKEFNG